MPENRPEWSNPLEKIEQLLTCAICLDRYRNPRLLPCQHSFCLDPCMEGLIDYARRLVKCPECRAEHPIPYDGVKAFQINYTLIGFLEIHLQASEANAAEIEAYIKRYNMERCKVCDEKAEVEYCAHCQKRVCPECKRTHTEMLKRDLARLMNQVKRISSRVAEASETLGRSLDSLQLNCETTKHEVHDYVGRFVRELKKREEFLVAEIDAFSRSESSFMHNIRDNLDLESINISEACARVEAFMKGDVHMSDEDMAKYKQMFNEGLELLRAFNPDADDFGVKRIRFAVGPDPHLLPHAITQFGELQIISAHMNAKLPASNYVPRFMNIVLESDNIPTKRKAWENLEGSSNNAKSSTTNVAWPPSNNHSSMQSDHGNSRQLGSAKAVQLGFTSPSNLGRWAPSQELSQLSEHQQQHQEKLLPTASPANRYLRSQQESDPRSRSPYAESNSSSPWAKVHQLQEPSSMVIANLSGTLPQSFHDANSSSAAAAPGRVVRSHHVTNLSSIVHPVDPPAKLDTRFVSSTSQQPTHPDNHHHHALLHESDTDSALDERVNSIRREYKALDDRVETIRREHEARSASKGQNDAVLPAAKSSTSPSFREQLETDVPSTSKFMRPRTKTLPEELLRELGSRSQSSSSRDTSPEDHEIAQVIPVVHYPAAAMRANAEDQVMQPLQVLTAASVGESRSRTPPIKNAIDWKKYLIPSPTGGTTATAFRSAKEFEDAITADTILDSTKTTRRNNANANNGSGEIATAKSGVNSREDLSWNERRKHFTRSRTNPDFAADVSASPLMSRETVEQEIGDIPGSSERSDFADRCNDYRAKYLNGIACSSKKSDPASEKLRRQRMFRRSESGSDLQLCFDSTATTASSAGSSSNPSLSGGQIVFPSTAAVGRMQSHSGAMDEELERRSRYRRKAERAHSAMSYGGTDVDETPSPGGCSTLAKPLSATHTDRATSETPIRHEQTTALSGGENGYAVPRSVAAPKFDYSAKGKMLLKFGSKGAANGQFNWPRGVAVSENIIAVCDSSNHRVQLFDYRGNHIKSFGSYGSGPGEFDCLAGICINKYNQFIVTDRYNHRVQIFDVSGRFLREFGSHGQNNSRFHSPWGVTVDSQGFIYVADKDNNRIQIFQADGNFVGKFGSIGNRDGQLQNPHCLCFKNNQIVVSDSSNHRIQVFDHNGHFLFGFGSEGFHEGQFKYPRGVIVDDNNFIIVADSGNNRVQVFNPDGRFRSAFGTWGTNDGQLKGVEGIALLTDGRIVVSDRENHRLQIF